MPHDPASAFSKLPSGHVLVRTLRTLPSLVHSLGGDVQKVLRPLKLNDTFLENPENMVPLSTFGALLNSAAKETGCEHFGLLVGSHSGIKEMGLAGKLMLHAPTVGLALEILKKYLHLVNRHALVFSGRRSEAGEEAFLAYAVLDGNFPGVQELQDGAIAVALNIMRTLIGPHWHPAEVQLMRRAPRQPEAYESHFGAPCRFNAVRSELIFPAATLDLPLATSGGPTLSAATAAYQTDSSFSLHGQDWIEMVRRTTLGLLLTGNCSRQAVADALGLSARTLNRKLERVGSSFLAIVDYTRFTASRTLVKGTDMPLGEVAKALGYADSSSFCRAFKRWSGVSPSEWRKAAGA
jgi:AraC-like DNA-binding protein